MCCHFLKRVLTVALSASVATVSLSADGNKSADPVAAPAAWQVATSTPTIREITLDGFLREVLAANLDYASARFNVDIARAETAAARLFPNPTLDLGADRDLTFHGQRADDGTGNTVSQTMPESRSIGLTQTIELGGKRRWRIRVAEQTYRATVASLDDFLRLLRIDASAAFAEALAARQTVEQQRRAVDYLGQLVQAQKLRFEKGDLGEADYLQSRLEALQLENELRSAEAAATTAQLALCTFLGREAGQTTLVPRGQLEVSGQDFDLVNLTAKALVTRPDLVALRHVRDAAQSGVRVAKAGRVPDVDVGVTYTANRASENFVAPSPRFNQIGLGVSLPLPLWNRNQHEVRKANASAGQAQRQLEAAELKAEVEIRTAHANYRAALARVRQYQGELLRGGETVLDARRYSYERGQTSLLELLEAQRTNNDIAQGYHDALADATKAKLGLLRAAGLDDR